ncbi:hypothetical protein [Vibrio cyclitrophicus]|uniref:hypothetical protein n=1 Tax=Vibrio cyclitrophicus TaxID=47951 RepID=UPI0002F47BFA|nr:hypothetical protein [Vibrio cyclitrophicus]
MSQYEKEFKTGDTKKLRYGSKQADTIREAADKKGIQPNDYVKEAALKKAKECR